MAVRDSVDAVWICSWVSIHMHRRAFEAQDRAGDGKGGGVGCRSGARGQLSSATRTAK